MPQAKSTTISATCGAAPSLSLAAAKHAKNGDRLSTIYTFEGGTERTMNKKILSVGIGQYSASDNILRFAETRLSQRVTSHYFDMGDNSNKRNKREEAGQAFFEAEKEGKPRTCVDVRTNFQASD
jgi:hypothetical protein